MPSPAFAKVPSTVALLFDFDGVLAQTVNLHIAAWERTFTELGWGEPPRECEQAGELDDRALIRLIFGKWGVLEVDVSAWIQRKQSITLEMLGERSVLVPGVLGLVQRIRDQGLGKLAVVSSTWRENILKTLDAAGLRESFDLIVSKEDVEQVKPHPECYFKALAELGVPGSRAIAIEDSPTGYHSARAAGIAVVAVGARWFEPGANNQGLVPQHKLRDFRDIEQVLALLSSISLT